jgi:L-rhamnose mutarotase
MERLCYTFQLAVGMEVEYDRRHAEIWPALVTALKAASFSNYSLFRNGREVIAYAECEPSIEFSMNELENHEVNSRWNSYIRVLMTRAVDSDGKFHTFDEIWHLD